MHDHPKGESALLTTGDEDRRDQQMVLREVLALIPEIRTMDELTRYLTVASADYEDHDRIQRAVRELVAGGLLHLRAGDLVLPAMPAVHFKALTDDEF
jgi:hypothetical protein